jgi:hypothetical protein
MIISDLEHYEASDGEINILGGSARSQALLSAYAFGRSIAVAKLESKTLAISLPGLKMAGSSSASYSFAD